MQTTAKILVEYLFALLRQWTAIASIVLGAVDFIVNYIDYRTPLPHKTYWIIFGAGYVLANIQLYISLRKHITTLESGEARISIRVERVNFHCSAMATSPILRDVRVGPYGFDERGLPGWGGVFAVLIVANEGYEDGEVEWELDMEKAKLPDIFDRGRNIRDRQKIPCRQERRLEILHDFKIAETDPRKFAIALKSVNTVEFVLHYRALRVGGDVSSDQTLRLKDDFTSFRQTALNYWTDHPEFNELVKLASGRGIGEK